MTDQPGRRTPADPAGPQGSPTSPGLRRSRSAKVIGGVCGGLGRHYDLDPVIFRVVLAVLAIAGGTGLIAYGFAWLLVPLDGEDENEGRRLLSGRVEGQGISAVLCALLGCGLLLSVLGNPPVLTFSVLVAGALVGSASWSQRRRRAEQQGAADAAAAHPAGVAPPAHGPAQEGVPPETQAPPAPGAPSWWRDPLTKEGPYGGPAGSVTGTTGTGYLWGPDDGRPYGPPHGTGPAAPPPAGSGGPYGAPWAAARPPKRPAWIGGWIFLLAAAACATGVLATWGTRPLGTSLETGLACALAVFGLGLAVSSRFGRAGGGTVVFALLTAALLVPAAALPKSATADWSHKDWAPASASALRPGYHLGTGIGTLDLTRLRLAGGQTVRTSAVVGVGQLKVVAPENATLRLRLETGLGDQQLPGERPDDVHVAPGQEREVTLRPADGRPARGTLELDLHVGVGQLEVTRAAP